MCPFCFQYPKAFAASLLDYVGSQAQYLHTLLAMSQSNKVESQAHAERLRFAEMALEALRNVIKNNPGGFMCSSSYSANLNYSILLLEILNSFMFSGSESECIGHFKLLFSLLRVHGAGRVQQLVLEVGGHTVTVHNLLLPLHFY